MRLQKINVGDTFVMKGQGDIKIELSFINYLNGYIEYGNGKSINFLDLKDKFRKL
jgi:hypothetical protein